MIFAKKDFFIKLNIFCSIWSTYVSTISEPNHYVNIQQILQLYIKKFSQYRRPPALEPVYSANRRASIPMTVYSANRRASIPMTPLSQMQVWTGVRVPRKKNMKPKKKFYKSKRCSRNRKKWKNEKTKMKKWKNEKMKKFVIPSAASIHLHSAY